MDLKARRKLVGELLAKLENDLDAIIVEAPEHWEREEFEWLTAHRAQGMSSNRTDLGLRRRSFNNTVRQKSWLPKKSPAGPPGSAGVNKSWALEYLLDSIV